MENFNWSDDFYLYYNICNNIDNIIQVLYNIVYWFLSKFQEILNKKERKLKNYYLKERTEV